MSKDLIDLKWPLVMTLASHDRIVSLKIMSWLAFEYDFLHIPAHGAPYWHLVCIKGVNEKI